MLENLQSRLTAGASAIDTRESTLERYARTTLPHGTRPQGVFYAQTTEDVQAVVLFARERKLRLHPISRGCNWGYGNANAPADGFWILDLSGMNRILEANEELAYAVIEPGVTPGMLYQHLQERGLALWMDANGAGPDTSLMGNFLERGFGHTPLGERTNQHGGMQVVLGSGEILETGFGHYPNTPATHTYRHGVGPALDGLFFQSCFGVVTRLGINLMPKPEAFNGFHCSASAPEDLGPLVQRLAKLRRTGVVRSCVHILNPLRSLVKRVSYPWEETEGKRAVSKATIDEWRRQHEVGSWNATGGVYGPPEMVRASMNVIRETLAPFSISELSDEALEEAKQTRTAGHLAALQSARRFLRGIPAEAALATAAWRSRTKHTEIEGVLRDAGLIWIVPTLPATGEHATRVEALLKSSLEPAGFDVPITFTLLNERTLTCTSNISFDRSSPEDAKRALDAYHSTVKTLIAAGYPPYRSGVGGYELLHDGSSFWEAAGRIKKAFDPDGVISPGHYLPLEIRK